MENLRNGLLPVADIVHFATGGYAGADMSGAFGDKFGLGSLIHASIPMSSTSAAIESVGSKAKEFYSTGNNTTNHWAVNIDGKILRAPDKVRSLASDLINEIRKTNQ